MLARLVRNLTLLMLLCDCGQPASPTATVTAHDDSAGAETTPQPVAEPAPEAQFRLIHAAIDARDQAVTLVTDGATETSPAGYQYASAYVGVTPGTHSIDARANAAQLIQASFAFSAGPTTVVAYSTGDFPVALVLAPDTTAVAAADSAQLRVFHAIVGQGPIDLCHPSETPRADGAPIIANITLGTFGDPGYVSLPAGSQLPLQIRAGNATPCHGRPLGLTRFTPAAEGNYTLIFMGRTGRHRAPMELLFCADPPAADTSCASVAVEPP